MSDVSGRPVIRTLDLKDDREAEAIVALQRTSYRIEAALIGSDAIPPLYDTVTRLRESSETFHAYELEGTLVGVVAYKRVGDLLDIHRLAVHPGYFRRGIARALLHHLGAVEPGVTRTIVSTGSKNAPARALYIKEGFHETGEVEVMQGLFVTQFERSSD